MHGVQNKYRFHAKHSILVKNVSDVIKYITYLYYNIKQGHIQREENWPVRFPSPRDSAVFCILNLK